MPLVPKAIVKPNAFEFQVNNFACNLSLPAGSSLVSLLTLGSDLYLGYLRSSVFLESAQQSLEEKLGGLFNACSQEVQQDWLHYFDFQLKMIYQGQVASWHLPALINLHKNILTWHTGSTRLLATWLCKSGTGDFPVLLTDFDRAGIDHWLEPGWTKIRDDHDLSRALRVKPRLYDQHQGDTNSTNCEVYLEWNQSPGPCLHYVKPLGKILDWSNHESTVYAPQVVQQVKKIQEMKPTVMVHADSPDQVKDSSRLFHLQHQGPGVGEEESLTALSYKRLIRQPKHIEVWVKPNRCIDLSHLIFWLDGSTVYCDRHSRFAIVMPGSGYSPGGSAFLPKDVDLAHL